MKTLLLIALSLVHCQLSIAQQQSLVNLTQASSSPAGKTFAIVGNVHHTYPGTSLSFTATTGNALVVVGQCNSIATLTISDGVNTYVLQQHATQSTGGAITDYMWTSVNITGGSLSLVMSGAGAAPDLTAIEFSGVTAVDVSGQSLLSTPYSVVLTTTSTDMFFWSWGNENNDILTSQTINPGGITPSLQQYDGASYSADWMALNPSVGVSPGTGYPAGTYTNALVAGNNSIFFALTLK